MSEGDRSGAGRDRPSLADLAFFAPLGLALDASQLVPELAQRGRRELQRRVDSAAFVGRLALRYGPAFVGGAARGWGRTGPGHPSGPGGSEEPDGRAHTASRDQGEPGGHARTVSTDQGERAGRLHTVSRDEGDRDGRARTVADGHDGRRRPDGSRGRQGRGVAVRVAEPVVPSALGGEALPDASGLAIPGYDALSALQVVGRLGALRPDELDAVAAYERAHRGRRTILAKVSQLARAGAPGAVPPRAATPRAASPRAAGPGASGIPAEDPPARTVLGEEGQSPP